MLAIDAFFLRRERRGCRRACRRQKKVRANLAQILWCIAKPFVDLLCACGPLAVVFVLASSRFYDRANQRVDARMIHAMSMQAAPLLVFSDSMRACHGIAECSNGATTQSIVDAVDRKHLSRSEKKFREAVDTAKNRD